MPVELPFKSTEAQLLIASIFDLEEGSLGFLQPQLPEAKANLYSLEKMKSIRTLSYLYIFSYKCLLSYAHSEITRHTWIWYMTRNQKQKMKPGPQGSLDIPDTSYKVKYLCLIYIQNNKRCGNFDRTRIM